MTRQTENTGFICLNCTKIIQKVTNGSYRNHCPFCLYSVHVDNVPGDRSHACRALMEPIGLIYKPKKGWQIIHRCLQCAFTRVNKAAIDTVQPDDPQTLANIGYS